MSDIIRNLQIDLIMNIQNPIIDIFNGIWDELSVVELNTYHIQGNEFILYDKNNEWVFFIDNQESVLFCSKIRYWDIIGRMVTRNFSDISKITKILVENKLNTTMGNEPNYLYDSTINQVVKTLNNYNQGIIKI